jgi:hypothetical protein
MVCAQLDTAYRSTEIGVGIREGEAPSELLAGVGSPGSSPSRGIFRPLPRGEALRLAEASSGLDATVSNHPDRARIASTRISPIPDPDFIGFARIPKILSAHWDVPVDDVNLDD